MGEKTEDNNENQIPTLLHRYTSLPILLDLLYRRKLVLVRTEKWPDKNDTGGIKIYEDSMDFNVYAICFTSEQERNFYWDSIGGGADCRITFNGEELCKSLKENKGIRCGKVKYKKINELKDDMQQDKIFLQDIPFIKRWPYQEEKEFRIIWESKKQKDSPSVMEFNIGLDVIDSITLSDNIHKTVSESIKAIIKCMHSDIPDRISQVTVHENEDWLNCLKEIRK